MIPEREPSDALTQYYRDVQDVQFLSAQEERTLIIRYLETGCHRAKDRILRGAVRYVIAEARKHHRGKHDRTALQELIGAGNIGLLRALDKFNPECGTRFLTYAGWWVRHEMREESRKLSILHVPAHALAKGVKPPAASEIDEETLESEYVTDTSSEVDMQRSVHQLLDASVLSVREKFIIKACYGVQTPVRTLQQIGKLLNITGERVRQLRETALRKLKNTRA